MLLGRLKHSWIQTVWRKSSRLLTRNCKDEDNALDDGYQKRAVAARQSTTFKNSHFSLPLLLITTKELTFVHVAQLIPVFLRIIWLMERTSSNISKRLSFNMFGKPTSCVNKKSRSQKRFEICGNDILQFHLCSFLDMCE